MSITKSVKTPIGLFDSGIGGLTVAKEVFDYMPREGIVYFGDTARVPYGSKSPEQLKGFAKEILEFLITRRVKYVILACNTSSSVSLDYLKQLFRVPMVGVVQPGAEEAARVTTTGKIGIIATEATVKSNAYKLEIENAAKRYNKGITQVFSVPAPKLVPLVESGRWDSDEARAVLKGYLAPLEAKGIDTLVLGCTHYPFLMKTLRSVIEPGITIIDPAKLTVRQAHKELLQLGILNDSQDAPSHEYWVSGDAKGFKHEAEKFLGRALPNVNRANLR